VYDVTITSNFFDAAAFSSPGGPVKYGNTFTCSLVKKTPGFRFEGWYAQNGTLLSSSETYSFAVKDHVLIEARFSIVHDASFTVTLSNGKAPTNVTLTSAYNVEVAYRLWVIDDKLTGSRLRDLTGTKGQLNQTVYSAPHGQALSIIHSVTYSDGYTAFSRCTEVVDENVVKHFEWNYNRSADTSKLVTGTAAMAVPMNFAWYYDAVASKVPRSNGFNQLGPYVECNDPVIQWVAQELWRQARASDMTTLQTINFILKFIQSFPYITDTENKGVSNYWNLPPETLWEKRGDCEDHAFLLAAILKCLGIRCVVHSIHCFDGPVYTGAHVAVGVEVWNGSGSYVIVDGVKYFHCEATANVSTNWHWAYVGYLPQGDVIMATYKV
jgi:predicted transglutaminase-like cysteine proteinase